QRVGRAGLLAGGLHLAVVDRAALLQRPPLDPVDPLYAEGALLDQPLRAHGHVGVELRVQRRRPGDVRLPVVEAQDVVGAVVGTVARPDAAVVDLRVQPVGRVVGGVDRADRLAGRVAAVLAHYRYEARLDVRELAFPVPLDADPLLGPGLEEAVLLVERYVVLGLAGDDAGAAAGAAVDVDDHAPAVPLVLGRLVPVRGQDPLQLGELQVAHLSRIAPSDPRRG